MSQLQRLILTFKPEEVIMHALYRTEGEAGPKKNRRREVTRLTREGLRQALASLEGRVDLVGTSGYEVREDIVLCTAKGVAQLDEHKGMKRGA
jgi:hypothetical protein